MPGNKFSMSFLTLEFITKTLAVMHFWDKCIAVQRVEEGLSASQGVVNEGISSKEVPLASILWEEVRVDCLYTLWKGMRLQLCSQRLWCIYVTQNKESPALCYFLFFSHRPFSFRYIGSFNNLTIYNVAKVICVYPKRILLWGHPHQSETLYARFTTGPTQS